MSRNSRLIGSVNAHKGCVERKPALQAGVRHGGLLGMAYRQIADVLHDRRGVTAVLFGVTAVVVVGMVGLGTEGGSWYVTKRDAQNAADTAAYAGAVRLSLAQSALSQGLEAARVQALATAIDTSTRNQFTSGAANTTVTPNTPPSTGANTGNITAVEVIVQRNRPRLISNLFVGGNQVIRVRGVAAVLSNGSACLLAIPGSNVTGQLELGSAAAVNAGSCVLASNSTRNDAIDLIGNSPNGTVMAASLVSSGGCDNCGSSRVTLDRPFQTIAPPTTNPLAYLDTKVLPTSFSCYTEPVYTTGGAVSTVRIDRNIGSGDAVVIPAPPTAVGSAPQAALCGLSITGGTVSLIPGTYYIVQKDMEMTNGRLDCPTCVGGRGVTIVLTGSPVPEVKVTGGDMVLSAPTTAMAADPDYAGILFFRDPRSTQQSVKLTGNGNLALTGGMYFPNSEVDYRGTAGSSQCSVLIGGTIAMLGTSGLNIDGCALAGYGNVVPQLQVVRLVE